MTRTSKTTRERRMVREPQTQAPSAAKAQSKLVQVETLLRIERGASIAELMEATGWQQHSVRGALAGAIKKRGLIVTSEKKDGVRRYSATAEQ